MFKAMYFKNKHGYPLFLCFNFISYHIKYDTVCKKLEKLNHNFNYTHTSLIYKTIIAAPLITVNYPGRLSPAKVSSRCCHTMLANIHKGAYITI